MASVDGRSVPGARLISLRRGLFALLLLLLALLAYWLMTPRKPRVRQYDGNRPNIVNMEMIDTWELNVGGRPFGEHLQARAGEDVAVSGVVIVKPEYLPKGMHVIEVRIQCHPAGTPESVWKRRYSPTSVHIGPGFGLDGRLPEPGRFEQRLNLKTRYFTPGEYEMRAYVGIMDNEGEQDRFDLMGKARLTVLP